MHDDTGVHDVIVLGSCRLQGGTEVFHGLASLRGVVSDSSRAAIEVQRAGAGEEDKARFGGIVWRIANSNAVKRN
jgi:NADH:ubiquinone oxidoreductase subunit B-like Fe-S oxidoreductase